MTKRERTIAAFRHQETDRPPFNLDLCPSQIETMKAKLGTDDPYQAFDMDMKFRDPVDFEEDPKLKTSKYYEKVIGAERINEWGIGYDSGAFHFESYTHPLAGFDEENDAADYPLPHIKISADAKTKVADIKKAGHACAGGVLPVGVWGTVFWPAYMLRGMEQILCDMIVNPGYTEILLDRVTALNGEMAASLVESGVDVLLLADDFGTQRDLIMSLEMWRKWFRNRLEKIVRIAKEKALSNPKNQTTE